MKPTIKISCLLLGFLTMALLFDACSKDNDPAPKETPAGTMDEETTPAPSVTVYEGKFLDAAVEGLSYASMEITGQTDSMGKFEYVANNNVTFSIGGITIGETLGKETIIPLDLVENGDVNNQTVRNIASFLQSLDEDSDATNGIKITSEVAASLSSKSAFKMVGATIDFSAENFYADLVTLINEINETHGTSLVVINPNDAALHLAETLGLETQFKILPKVVQGRPWEKGEYYRYNTTSDTIDEYLFKIESTLQGVRYHFGDGFGYYMDMEYKQDTLIGNGNIYVDLHATPPVETSGLYTYYIRKSSLSAVFDHDNNTYLGYYNYNKVEGELGELEGVYHNFLIFDRKPIDEDPIRLSVLNGKITIDEPNNDGDFPMTFTSYDRNGEVVDEGARLLKKEHIDAENILLVRFKESDILFFNASLAENDSLSYYNPGLYTIKK